VKSSNMERCFRRSSVTHKREIAHYDVTHTTYRHFIECASDDAVPSFCDVFQLPIHWKPQRRLAVESLVDGIGAKSKRLAAGSVSFMGL
jgi:hypothetical protein